MFIASVCVELVGKTIGQFSAYKALKRHLLLVNRFSVGILYPC
jgi:hypothetical protein